MGAQIDFESGLIEVTKARYSKTARRRLVSMQPNLRAWLAPYRAHRRGVVCPGNGGCVSAGRSERADSRELAAECATAQFRLLSFGALQERRHDGTELGHMNAAVTFAHYRELVRPKEAARYWQIKPARGASKKVVAFGSQ